MYKFLLLLGILGIIMCYKVNAQEQPEPEESLRMLKEGNERFFTGGVMNPNRDMGRREETAKNGQKPFATIVACSDSRVPVEILFDQGIGDLFVIKIAGNVCDVDEIGSIEYGVGHLGTPMLVILGHTSCGAVTAVTMKEEVHGSIPQLVDNIIPAVEKARTKHPKLKGKELVPEVIKENIFHSIEEVFTGSHEVRELVKARKLKVLGAMYDIETGTVLWLGSHPDEIKLVSKEGSESHEKSGVKQIKDKHPKPKTEKKSEVNTHSPKKEETKEPGKPLTFPKLK